MNKNIILIGYMGCGKTTIGKKIAHRYGMPMLDTDKRIEEECGITVSEIFDTQGEGAFRQMETDLLRKLLAETPSASAIANSCSADKTDKPASPMVISVGGGLPKREENRPLLKELGTVVFLRAKPETIYKRLQHDTTRPLLRGDNPQQKIRDMIRQRMPFYLDAATKIVDVDEKSYENIIREIME